MRKLMLTLLSLIALATGLPGDVGATFIGDYDVANWTTFRLGNPPGGGGSVLTSGRPDSITLLGGDNGCMSQSSIPCVLAFMIQQGPTDGFVTFHWGYQTTDSDGPSFDRFGYTLQGPGQFGTFTQLSNDLGPNFQSGDVGFPIRHRILFGFQIDCTDCLFGPANATISDFAVSPIPEPGTMLLFGSSLAGLGLARWRRRRRKQQTSIAGD